MAFWKRKKSWTECSWLSHKGWFPSIGEVPWLSDHKSSTDWPLHIGFTMSILLCTNTRWSIHNIGAPERAHCECRLHIAKTNWQLLTITNMHFYNLYVCILWWQFFPICRFFCITSFTPCARSRCMTNSKYTKCPMPQMTQQIPKNVEGPFKANGNAWHAHFMWTTWPCLRWQSTKGTHQNQHHCDSHPLQ